MILKKISTDESISNIEHIISQGNKYLNNLDEESLNKSKEFYKTAYSELQKIENIPKLRKWFYIRKINNNIEHINIIKFNKKYPDFHQIPYSGFHF